MSELNQLIGFLEEQLTVSEPTPDYTRHNQEIITYIEYLKSMKQLQLNPNQQIVLDWLKKEKIKRSTLDILIIRELAELIYHGYFSEELVYKAFMEINRKQQAQVLQAFIRWAIEQEEG